MIGFLQQGANGIRLEDFEELLGLGDCANENYSLHPMLHIMRQRLKISSEPEPVQVEAQPKVRRPEDDIDAAIETVRELLPKEQRLEIVRKRQDFMLLMEMSENLKDSLEMAIRTVVAHSRGFAAVLEPLEWNADHNLFKVLPSLGAVLQILEGIRANIVRPQYQEVGTQTKDLEEVVQIESEEGLNEQILTEAKRVCDSLKGVDASHLDSLHARCETLAESTRSLALLLCTAKDQLEPAVARLIGAPWFSNGDTDSHPRHRPLHIGGRRFWQRFLELEERQPDIRAAGFLFHELPMHMEATMALIGRGRELPADMQSRLEHIRHEIHEKEHTWPSATMNEGDSHGQNASQAYITKLYLPVLLQCVVELSS